MTYSFFQKNYDLSDMEIKKIEVKNHKLYLSVLMNVSLDLIANGYRPEMNFNQEKTFIFSVDYKDAIFSLNASIILKNESILIDNNELKITFSEVDIM